MKKHALIWFSIMYLLTSCSIESEQHTIRLDNGVKQIVNDYIATCKLKSDKHAIILRYNGCSYRQVIYIENIIENPYLNENYPSEYLFINGYMVLLFDEAKPYLNKGKIGIVNDFSLKHLQNEQKLDRLYDPVIWKVIRCGKSISINKGYIPAEPDCMICK